MRAGTLAVQRNAPEEKTNDRPGALRCSSVDLVRASLASREPVAVVPQNDLEGHEVADHLRDPVGIGEIERAALVP